MKPKELISRTGGPTKLARSLGYKTHTAVLKWHEIPLHQCIEIEKRLGIPREELRPDFFISSRAERVASLYLVNDTTSAVNTPTIIASDEIATASDQPEQKLRVAERYEP